MSAPISVERELSCERFPEKFVEIKMTSGSVRGDIMTVELAMQRELAYRKKMERLQSEQHNGFQEPSMLSVHGMPSEQKFVGTKRKAPSGNFPFLPPEHPTQAYRQQPLPVNPFCKECKVLCSSAFTLKQHYKGKKHQSRLEELARHKSSGKTGTRLLWCEVCKIPCMNELCFQQHLSGKKHLICLQAINSAKSARGEGDEEVPMPKWKEF